MRRDVAPSGLVCSFILTIAVKLFKYFSNVGLIVFNIFIHLCCDIFVGLFIVPSVYLYYLKILPKDFKMVIKRMEAFPLLLNKEEIF